jgi:DNA repair photolyase
MERRDDILRGRGTAGNPGNRFEEVHRAADPEAGSQLSEEEALEPRASTTVIPDHARSIVAENSSPDVGFEASINPYRGCEHGCIYCYARPTHEYLGFSAGLDFETKIVVKHEAPALLRRTLAAASWEPKVLAMSGVTDCYQPLERRFRLTRGCLEVLSEFRNPVCIITKNALVTRDIDVLGELARFDAASVCLSVTSLDPALTGIMEPRTSRPAARLDAIRRLRDAGVPVSVNIAPVVPGLTEHEIPAILEAAWEAGARDAWFVPIRLPFAVAPLFEEWLGHHFPDRKEKVLNRIRGLRGGRLNDPDFHTRMRGDGLFAQQIGLIFRVTARRLGFGREERSLSAAHFRRPAQPGEQMPLFD